MADIDTLMITGQDASVDDTSMFKDPLKENVYCFVDNGYYGTCGFRDGTYLIPHQREMFYTARRQNSTYKNFVRPILDATVNPIFQDEIPRTVDPNSLFATFMENVDNSGTTLQEFMDEVTHVLVRHGQVFIVMDNFPLESQPATAQEAKQARIFPYVMIKTALDVADHELDRWGNLTSITFYDIKTKIEDKEVQLYRKWDTINTYLLKKDNKGKFEVIAVQPHGLGKIPVIVSYRTPRTNKKCLFMDPPAYDFVRLALAIYNKESEARDLERAQAFSLLVLEDDKRGNKNIGAHNVLYVPSGTNITPSFISPDPNIMMTLMVSIEKLRDDLYRLAEQNGVTGVKTEASGIAESFRFFGHESVLRQVSMLAKNIELKIAALFQLYTNENLTDYNADYPTEFSPGNVTSEVDMIDKYLKMDPPSKAEALAMEKVTRLVLADQDEDLLEDAIEQIREEGKEETPEQETKEEIPPKTEQTEIMNEEDMQDTDEQTQETE